jgi:hypothetical protein
MVIDARTGEVLRSRNADARLHPASLTKMMTLYIAFEAVEAVPSPHADLPAGRFEVSDTKRTAEDGTDAGGGIMSVMRGGRHFEKVGVNWSEVPLTEEEHARNNLPDVLARWQALEGEADRPRTAQSFMVPRGEIVATGSWDLSLNRYKEIDDEEVEHQSSAEIIAELRVLEDEITEGLDRLEGMLG